MKLHITSSNTEWRSVKPTTVEFTYRWLRTTECAYKSFREVHRMKSKLFQIIYLYKKSIYTVNLDGIWTGNFYSLYEIINNLNNILLAVHLVVLKIVHTNKKNIHFIVICGECKLFKPKLLGIKMLYDLFNFLVALNGYSL